MLSIRYLVLGIIDGMLITLGIVMGMNIGELQVEHSLMIKAAFSGGLAAAISNSFGTYIAEESVEQQRIRAIEAQLLLKEGELLNTEIHNNSQKHIFTSIITMGLAVFTGAFIPLIPFLIPNSTPIALSIAISIISLFFLGIYTGWMTKRNLFHSGIKVAVIGLLVALICALI
jgi:predicted membrane protein (TIGR00267 family)